MTVREFKQFLDIARGSTYEIQTQLELEERFGLAQADSIDKAESLSQQVGRMIEALIESLRAHGSTMTDH